MATLDELSSALVKADAAGNADDARALAGEIRKMRAAPVATPAPEKTLNQSFLEGARDLTAGAVRGAGSIGATLVAPYDVAKDAINGKGLSLESNRERRKGMDDALQTLGADTNSLSYGGGKLAGEIAGTAGVGGGLAGLLSKIPGLATKAAPVIEAIRSSGMAAGGLTGKAGIAARVAGGAVTGGASAGLVNPEDAAMGAGIGAVAPPIVMAGAKAGGAVGNAVRSALTPQDVKLAQKLAVTTDMPVEQLRSLLQKQGPQLIDNYQATVPQLLQNPAVSQLQRTLKTAGNDALGSAERTQQQQFMQTINRVAPVNITVQDAAARAGGAIEDFARPAERAATANVNRLFDAVPADEAVMQLPLQRMQDAQTRFLGPGTFGKGGATAEQAMQTATNIGMDQASLTPHAVPFDQIQSLRSSIGEAITDAQKNGRNQAAAALTQMKTAIDNKMAEGAGGTLLPGEVFTPNAIDAWGQALAAHSAKKQQFATGPQVSMFRKGGDGQTVKQGAEIPGQFYSGKRSQVEDMQAFNRLIGNDAQAPALTRELQSYATTEGANTATAAGNLSSKYGDWLASRSGANRGLFDPGQNAALKAVDDAIQTGASAENLGRVLGPDTAQKLVSLQSLGLMDSKAIDAATRFVPWVGKPIQAGVDGLRNTARNKQADTLAQLLADPQQLDAALGKIRQAKPVGELAQALLRGGVRSAPVAISSD